MRLNRILLMAASFSLIIFAMVFTISCSGDDGARGADGATGPAGPAGPAGAAGAAGASCIVQETAKDSGIFDVLCGGTKVGQLRSGTDGADGANGADGQNGQNGTNGTNGTNGQAPYIVDGYWWVNGAKTDVSATGAKATDVLELITIGKDGYWYIGTFKTNVTASPQLVDGYWWVNGENSGVAATGNHGLTPYIGENGNWWVGEEDLKIAATGTPGDHGVTPTIGENGNWFFGLKDTGVRAQGTNGSLVEIVNGILVIDGEETAIHANHKCTIEMDNLSIWCDNVEMGFLDDYFCRVQTANEYNLGKDILKCGSTTFWLCQGVTVEDGFNCEEKKCESTGGFYEDSNKGYNYFPHCYENEADACLSGNQKGHANYKWESGSCVAKGPEEKCEDAGKHYESGECYDSAEAACEILHPTHTWKDNVCVPPGKDPDEECAEEGKFWDSGKSECLDEAACTSDTDYKWESGSCVEKDPDQKCIDAGKFWDADEKYGTPPACYVDEPTACSTEKPTWTWENNVCVPPNQGPQQTCEAEANTWDATLGASGECLKHIEVCGDDYNLANSTFTTIPHGFYNVLTQNDCYGSKFLCRGYDNETKNVTYNGVTKNNNYLNESSAVDEIVEFEMVKDDSERTILIVDAGTVHCTTGY